MRLFWRWLGLLAAAFLALQIFFAARIALMAVVDPQLRVHGMQGLRAAVLTPCGMRECSALFDTAFGRIQTTVNKPPRRITE